MITGKVKYTKFAIFAMLFPNVQELFKIEAKIKEVTNFGEVEGKKPYERQANGRFSCALPEPRQTREDTLQGSPAWTLRPNVDRHE